MPIIRVLDRGLAVRGGPGDLFRVASITKSFVATLTLMLEAEGKLSLEAPIDTYLTGVPRGETITVRQILEHRSGLFNYTESVALLEAVQAEPSKVWTP